MTAVAVIVGAGPARGLGASLARRVAREGLCAIVAGRTQERLDAIVADIRASGGTAEPRRLDATDESAVDRLFASLPGPAEIVVANAGRNERAASLDTGVELFEAMWRANALAGFIVARAAARTMAAQGRGTLILTGATASLRARPPFMAFAAAKAALRAVAQGFARECGPKGVHVAHVVVDGVIRGEIAETRFPEFVAAKGPDGLIDPDAIADACWALHMQPRSAWTHELDLRPFNESF